MFAYTLHQIRDTQAKIEFVARSRFLINKHNGGDSVSLQPLAGTYGHARTFIVSSGTIVPESYAHEIVVYFALVCFEKIDLSGESFSGEGIWTNKSVSLTEH